MDAERDGGWSLIPGGVAASGMFDSDGRHCTSEEADRVRTVLEVFPELIGRRTIPEIAEALKSHGVQSRLVIMPKSGHVYIKRPDRTEYINEMISFFSGEYAKKSAE